MAATTVGKPRQIKAWPDLTGLTPLLKAQDKLVRSKGSRIHLDLSQVYAVDAIGMAVFLARLSQLRAVSLNSTSTVSNPGDEHVWNRIHDMDFEARVTELGFELSNHRGLFDEPPCLHTNIEEPKRYENAVREAVITVIPSSAVNRESLISNAKRKIKDFLQHDKKRTFAHEQLMIVLLEMVKNTLDHSGRPAIIGLKLQQFDEKSGRFSFCYCDTGEGIGRTVRKCVQDELTGAAASKRLIFSTDRAQVARLMQKGGFSDILHWALQPGNSTKSGNGINLGLGLMLIVEGARNCGLRLSLKDADSMWLLTALHAPYSHAEIRRFGANTCADPLLVYHGEMEFRYGKK